MSRIIGFAGRKRSGKGMLANSISGYYDKCVTVTIADSLKYLCCTLLDMDYHTLNEIKDNGTQFSYSVTDRWINIINKETGIDKDVIKDEIGNKKYHDVREMLQSIGTDLIRKYYLDWHINKAIEVIKSYSDDVSILVDDVRFPNEKKKLEALGGEVFFVVRPNNWEVSNHASERALRYWDFEPNKIIINMFSKEQMETYFRFYFNGINGENNPLFLSPLEYRKYEIPEIDNEHLRNIIDYLKQDDVFINYGVIVFESNRIDLINNFKKLFNGCCPMPDSDGKCVRFYDPLINETLKWVM